MRLDKYLASQGVGSRATVKEYIKKGQVAVNGAVAKSPDTKVNESTDTVTFNGKAVAYEEHRYFMLHKPAGCVSATTDPHHTTVLDYLKGENLKNLFPVGRLDIDTEGLLLITDDGELSHHLLSPAHHVAKTYYAQINGVANATHVDAFAQGIDIGDDKPTLPAELVIKATDETAGTSEVELTITEGRYHQVKRCFKALGMEVTYLKRLSMGGVTLDPALKKGTYRRLSDTELEALKS